MRRFRFGLSSRGAQLGGQYRTDDSLELQQIYYSKLQLLCDLLSFLALAGVTIFLIVSWDSFPERLPSHYDIAGEIDGWGGRGSLLFMPVLGWVLWLGLSALMFFPRAWNLPVKVTAANAERVYTLCGDMLGLIKLLCVLLFAYLTWHSTTLQPLPVWFMWAALALNLGVPLVYTWRIRRPGAEGEI